MVALACFLVNLAACLLVCVPVVFQPFSLCPATLTAWGGEWLVFEAKRQARQLHTIPSQMKDAQGSI